MKSQLSKIVGIAIAFVFISWAAFWWSNLWITDNAERGQFGDKFGALNTLFTGLAFVGVVAALWHERESGDQREAEMSNLLSQMERTAAALEVQATMEARTRYLTALVARIEGYTTQFLLYGRTPDLVAEQDRLLHELHAALNESRKQVGACEVTADQVAKWQRDRSGRPKE